MRQMIFDYVCDLADDPDSRVTDDDAWEIHNFVFSQFDCADIYDQIDKLIYLYFANNGTEA